MQEEKKIWKKDFFQVFLLVMPENSLYVMLGFEHY